MPDILHRGDVRLVLKVIKGYGQFSFPTHLHLFDVQLRLDLPEENDSTLNSTSGVSQVKFYTTLNIRL